MYEPRFTKRHSHKKEMQHSNILKGYISVTLHVLKLLSILEWVFEHCQQEHRQNEIQHKVYLSTLLRKRNATFHGAFLLRLSVYLVLLFTLLIMFAK